MGKLFVTLRKKTWQKIKRNMVFYIAAWNASTANRLGWSVLLWTSLVYCLIALIYDCSHQTGFFHTFFWTFSWKKWDESWTVTVKGVTVSHPIWNQLIISFVCNFPLDWKYCILWPRRIYMQWRTHLYFPVWRDSGPGLANFRRQTPYEL